MSRVPTWERVWSCLRFELCVLLAVAACMWLQPRLAADDLHVTPMLMALDAIPADKRTPAQQRMRALLQGCGNICRHDMDGEPSRYHEFIRKRVDCQALLTNEAIDAQRDGPAAPRIPEEMVDAFTYGGRVTLRDWWGGIQDQRYMGHEALTSRWTYEMVEDMKQECLKGTLNGNYGPEETQQLVRGLEKASLAGAHVAVIGSENPWVEACVLAQGALHVTTIEYGKITSLHPQVSSMTPDEVRADPGKVLGAFDAIVSYSSLEHSGLGRYGDALNPWGDRQAVARAYCMTKPGGHLVVGLPYSASEDIIEYNAHKVYGPVMIPHVMANWKQVWRADAGLFHNVWVGQRGEG